MTRSINLFRVENYRSFRRVIDGDQGEEGGGWRKRKIEIITSIRGSTVPHLFLCVIDDKRGSCSRFGQMSRRRHMTRVCPLHRFSGMFSEIIGTPYARGN